MYQYNYQGKQVMSKSKIEGAEPVESLQGEVFYLYQGDNKDGVHLIQDESFVKTHQKTLSGVLCKSQGLINQQVIGINTNHASSEDIVPLQSAYKVHVLGLGDVGGMMLSAMRLVGGETLSEIGIFDLDQNKVQRWLYELNQIRTIEKDTWPVVKPVDFEHIFDCDVFIFTASSQIPEVGSGVKDVRMYQLEANAKIIKIYAEKAAQVGFKGQFLVVSDPVDLLCKAVLDYGKGGLKPEQIKGFGLGVMHARACYYSEPAGATYYEKEGRAFGPHGKHLIVADSMINYDHEKSMTLTDMTIKANLDVRAVGYKPYIAPALSSAALSILAYLRGQMHHSTVYVDDVFFGCRNRAIALNVFEVEQHDIAPQLMERLESTYEELKKFAF